MPGGDSGTPRAPQGALIKAAKPRRSRLLPLLGRVRAMKNKLEFKNKTEEFRLGVTLAGFGQVPPAQGRAPGGHQDQACWAPQFVPVPVAAPPSPRMSHTPQEGTRDPHSWVSLGAPTQGIAAPRTNS